jgi:hypothetical protein
VRLLVRASVLRGPTTHTGQMCFTVGVFHCGTDVFHFVPIERTLTEVQTSAAAYCCTVTYTPTVVPVIYSTAALWATVGAGAVVTWQ